MKAAQVNKLYAKLTPHEQAALAMEAAAKHDDGEIDAILDQVERKHYLTCHADYIRRIHALTAIIGQYGIEYWKIRTLMLIVCDHVDQGNQQADETALRYLAKCVALEAAIVEVCNRLKVDVKAIKTMAGCPDEVFKPEELQKVDYVILKQYVDLFAGLVK